MRMHSRWWAIAASVGLLAVSARGAAVTPGNVIVLQAGDGTTTTLRTAVPVQFKEITPAGSIAQILAVQTSGDARFTLGYAATSEGQMTYNDNVLSIAGYDADPGTVSVSTTSTTSATPTLRRVLGFSLASGLSTTPSFNATTTAYTGTNIRGSVYSSVVNGSYIIGGGAPVIYVPPGAAGAGTTVASSQTPLGAIEIYAGNLYINRTNPSGGGTNGIYQVGTGLPTNTGNAETITVPEPAAANLKQIPSAYSFWISPDQTLAYIADDGNGDLQAGGVKNGGIKKYVKSGATWSLAYTINTDYDDAGTAVSGVRSVAVDATGPNAVLYATTVDGLKLLSFTDTGTQAGAEATRQILQTSDTNTLFTSVVFVPEPSTLVVFAFAGVITLPHRARVRRSQALL